MHAENYVLPLLLGGTSLLVMLILFLIFYIVIHKRKQHQSQLEKTQIEVEKAAIVFSHERELLIGRLEEQELTMNHISKEIHDNVSQKLDFLNMNVAAIKASLPGEDTTKFMENSLGLIAEISNELRNASYSLNGDYIKDRGLGEVILKELDYMSSVKDITTDIQIEGDYEDMDAGQELLIYRIAQEALHNILKHARATIVEVILRYHKHQFTMIISDNGIGVDEAKIGHGKTLGLKNMAQRAEILNAQLDFSSGILNGFEVMLHMNLQSTS